MKRYAQIGLALLAGAAALGLAVEAQDPEALEAELFRDLERLAELEAELDEARLAEPEAELPSAEAEAAAFAPFDPPISLLDRLIGETRFKLFTLYGPNDNTDIHRLVADPARFGSIEEFTRVMRRVNAASALVDASKLTRLSTGAWRLETVSFLEQENLCLGEDFWSQPVAAECSGFLVKPGVLATAGHCVTEDGLATTRFVWGFQMLSGGGARRVFGEGEVYSGREIIGRVEERDRDWALVALDREVELPYVEPVTWRRSGKVAEQDSLYIVGHPSGLPLKFSGNARVTDATPKDYFLANLDAFGGNSGSMVVNATTGDVEGILTSGGRDYKVATSGDCNVLFRCKTENDCKGEHVTRIAVLSDYL